MKGGAVNGLMSEVLDPTATRDITVPPVEDVCYGWPSLYLYLYMRLYLKRTCTREKE